MGMTGYARKRPRWREEERALAEAGLADPYADLDSRAKDFIRGREPKKPKKGPAKGKSPAILAKEKKILEVAAACKSGAFSPRRERDVLTEALGNPEHRGRVRGLGSRMSWKTVPTWQADASTYHTRQR